MRDARPILGPVVVAALLIAIVYLVQRSTPRPGPVSRRERPELLLPIWVISAALAFMMGGQFFHHYWVILTFPVSVAAAVIVSSVRRAPIRSTVVAIAVVPCLISAVTFITLPRSEVAVEISGYARSVQEERVGHWFRSIRRGDDTLYVMCASASVYAHADEDPPYPYLWFDNVNSIEGAGEKLRELLTSADGAPTYVARFQDPPSCALRGDDAQLLDALYGPFVIVDGILVMRRRSAG